MGRKKLSWREWIKAEIDAKLINAMSQESLIHIKNNYCNLGNQGPERRFIPWESGHKEMSIVTVLNAITVSFFHWHY